MNISWVVPCRHIEVAQDGLLILNGAGLHRLTPPHLPVQIPLPLAIRFSFDGKNTATTHKLTISIQSPSMEPVGPQLELNVNIPPAPVEIQGQLTQWLVNVRTMLVAADPGTYTITAAVDGKSAESVHIKVEPTQTD